MNKLVLPVTLVLGSTLTSFALDQVHGQEVVTIQTIDADTLISQEFVDISWGLESALKSYSVLAGNAGLTAHIASETEVILFTGTDADDARGMIEALDSARSTADERLGGPAPDAQPLIAFHLEDQGTYERLIDEIARKNTYLSSWVPTAKSLNGFALYQPMMCCVLENDLAPRDTSRNNLLVHQAALISFYQHFGVQPLWVREGFALDIEASVTDQLYAFAGSDGFVAKGRPKAWRKDMAKSWKRGKDSTFETLYSMSSAEFDRTQSYRAMGLVRYLLRENRDAFVSFLEILSVDREENLSNDPYYIAGAEVQQQKLDAILGDGWRKQALKPLAKAEKRDRTKTVASSKSSRSRSKNASIR